MACDLFTGKCTYATNWHPRVRQGHMIHWSVRYCQKPLYKFEVEKLYLMVMQGLTPGKSALRSLSVKDKILYQYKLRLYWMLLLELSNRINQKIKRIFEIG